MGREKVALYRSGTSVIAVLERDAGEFSAVDRLAVAQEVFRQSCKSGVPTNKIAILQRTPTDGIHRVQFIQYVPEANSIDLGGNCGNALIASYVHLTVNGYADQPLRMHSENTGQSSLMRYEGGRERTHSVLVEFLNPVGSVTHQLLPTGSRCDLVRGPLGQDIEVSIIDAGNLYVLVHADDISSADLMDWQEEQYADLLHVRRSVSERLGMDPQSVFPKVAAVAAPSGSDHNLQARMISVPSWHPSFASTGIVNLCASVLLEGSVVQQAIEHSQREFDGRHLTVRTPAGKMCSQILTEERHQVSSVLLQQKVTQLGGLLIDRIYSRKGRQIII